MAVGADFDVDVALVGRTGFKVVSACTHNADGGVVGVDLFLRHLLRQTFPAIFLIYCRGNWVGRQC